MLATIEKTFSSGKRRRNWEIFAQAELSVKRVIASPVPHVSLRAAWMSVQSELCKTAFQLWRVRQKECSLVVCASGCTDDSILASAVPHLCTTAFLIERNMIHDEHKVVALASAGARSARLIGGYVMANNEVVFEPQAYLVLPPALCAQLRSIKTLFAATPVEALTLHDLFFVQKQLVEMLESNAVDLFKSERHIRALLRTAAILFTKITYPTTQEASRTSCLSKAQELCRRYLVHPPPAATPLRVTLPEAASEFQGMPFASRKALAQRRNQLTGVQACGYYV